MLRRIAWDLTGLPADAVLSADFLSEYNNLSVDDLVDRLLASPHYGERWARYWLDIARYADTKGYVFFEKRPFVWAYTYRDYVIESFNNDKPFDQFVREQIAADLLPESKNDRSILAALGYITVGARFKNRIPDILDDRIDVVTRGLMGLTVTCARCHDHKYDPVSTEDYYSLYGIFANSIEPIFQPFLHADEFTPELRQQAENIENLADQLTDFQRNQYQHVMNDCRQRLADYLKVAQSRRSGPDTADFDVVVDGEDMNPQLLQFWQQYLEDTEQNNDPVFIAWHRLAKLPTENFSAASQELLSTLELESQPNKLVLQALKEQTLTSFQDVVFCLVSLLEDFDAKWQQENPTDPAEQQLHQVLYGNDSPLSLPLSQFTNLHLFPDRKSQEKLKPYFEKLHKAQTEASQQLAQALVLADAGNLVEQRVFKRGNPARPGKSVPRRFLSHFSAVSNESFDHSSGRKQLAEAIVSPQNPLTARVIVNRAWRYHFGRGLVETPSNFGLQGSVPSHPELLDHLANWLIKNDWSMKALHRYILNSATYRQQSLNRAECVSVDPENTYYWKMNRRRHDLESMRDTMLATAGQLDLTVGGPSVKNGMAVDAKRRTLYSFVDREDFPGVFRMFDFPNPDVSSASRTRTTVPGQSLFLMNHPLVFSSATAVANSFTSQPNDSKAIQLLFNKILTRHPTPEESADAINFLQNSTTYPEQSTAWSYGYGEFDPEQQKLISFQKLPHWTGSQWQGSPAWPDSKLGWVALNESGGHPGNDLKHVAIARWTAPQKMTINCFATLAHERKEGNGVRGNIAVNGLTKYGPWQVHNSTAETNFENLTCQAGDTLDFIVDINGNLSHDSYRWHPILTAADDTQQTTPLSWNYQQDFGNQLPMLRTPLERLAQILLLTNEFQFID